MPVELRPRPAPKQPVNSKGRNARLAWGLAAITLLGGAGSITIGLVYHELSESFAKASERLRNASGDMDLVCIPNYCVRVPAHKTVVQAIETPSVTPPIQIDEDAPDGQSVLAEVLKRNGMSLKNSL